MAEWRCGGRAGDLGEQPPAESEFWAATASLRLGDSARETTTDGEQKLAHEEDKASPPGSPRPKLVARPNPRMSGPEWTVTFNSFGSFHIFDERKQRESSSSVSALSGQSSRKCESFDLN
jgi:hypothetical protein